MLVRIFAEVKNNTKKYSRELPFFCMQFKIPVMEDKKKTVDIPVCQDMGCEVNVKGKKSKDDFDLRPEKTDFEKFVLKVIWAAFFICFAIFLLLTVEDGRPALRKDSIAFAVSAGNWLILSSQSGARSLIEFISAHLVSAMVPAFFLAAAISTFFSKETIILTIGKKANPMVSYPIAAFAGAILTVCSCGVLPIFMSLLQSGAGIGPAITFLYASPAINLISIIYTWKILPSMLWARIFAVAFCGIFIGVIMQKLFANIADEFEHEEPAIKKSKRKPWQEGLFFLVLVLVMLTSTDLFQGLTTKVASPEWFASRGPEMAIKTAEFAGKMLFIFIELIAVLVILRRWFTWDETRKWLKRTYRQAKQILPMVILGIFFSGFLGGTSSIVSRLEMVGDNSILSNLISSLIGSMLYFGSIVGVNVVDLFMRWGMHIGPALALLLAGPSISLPSVLALTPIMGKKRTFAFLVLVVLFSATMGIIFGSMVKA